MEHTASQVHAEHTGSDHENLRPSLYRHPAHRLVGGVCGGIADTLNIDPAVVRVLWVVLTVGTAGAGFLAYLVLWLLLPVGTTRTGVQEPATVQLNEQNMQRAGLLLVSIGALWLLANLGILSWIWDAFWTMVGVVFWPALLIGAGLLLLKNQKEWRMSLMNWRDRIRRTGQQWGGQVKLDRTKMKNSVRRARERIPLKRSSDDRILLGVCGGIARTFGIDSNLIRLFCILFFIGSIGTGALLYAFAGWLLPQQRYDAFDHEPEPQRVQVIDGRSS